MQIECREEINIFYGNARFVDLFFSLARHPLAIAAWVTDVKNNIAMVQPGAWEAEQANE